VHTRGAKGLVSGVFQIPRYAALCRESSHTIRHFSIAESLILQHSLVLLRCVEKRRSQKSSQRGGDPRAESRLPQGAGR